MKPQDVNEQLVGTNLDCWDIQDTFAFTYYKARNPVTGEEVMADVDYAQGTVKFWDVDNETVTHKFAIKATLEPITE